MLWCLGDLIGFVACHLAKMGFAFNWLLVSCIGFMCVGIMVCGGVGGFRYDFFFGE